MKHNFTQMVRSRIEECTDALKHLADVFAFLRHKDIYELLARRRQVAQIWNIKHVQSVRPGLNDDQAWHVLKLCDLYKDFNWDFVEDVADGAFPKSSNDEVEEKE